LDHPGVKTHHYYGLKVETGMQFYYADGNFEKEPKIINGDGDGTVNSFSLKSIQKWS